MNNKIPRAGVRSVARGAFRAGTLLGASALAAGIAQAQQARDAATGDVVEVFGERLEEGLGTRYTAPLLETPQTITLVTRELMEQQNLLTMREVLSTLPGITFTAGEGGGGYGDGVNLRGYSATSDISVDGVRDSAQYTRSDPFNMEQLELVSGANSVYTGAGSVGGSINLVSKTPLGRPATTLNVGAGMDSYARLSLDTEAEIGDVADFRLNLMRHENDVPGRDVERYERWGIAPSIAFGNGTDTRFALAYIHQEDDNIPQYGVPYGINAFNSGPLPGSPISAYYGYRNVDRQEITLDALSATFNHDFGDGFSMRNLTRWQQVDQYTVVDPPQGTWCIEPGINALNGNPCDSPGMYQPSGPRGTTRDTTNDILVNQTDFTVAFETGSVRHTLVTGFSFSTESYHRLSGNSLRNPLGETPNPTLPLMSISNPDNFYTGPVNFIANQVADGTVENRAAYIFDRLQFGERFEINGGVRVERNEGTSTTAAITLPLTDPLVITQNPVQENDDNLSSYRLGFVYKPSRNSSFYLAHGNSQTPSQSSVNGSCTAVATPQSGRNCNVDPEEAETFEIGGKWDVGGVLSLTAALFRNERTNFRVNSGDPTIPEQQLDGSSRVDGIALGAGGRIGERWSLFANYTYLDSEVIQSISDILIGGGEIDLQAGDPLPNTPEHSASFWATVRATDALTIGFGSTYQGEYTFNRAAGAPLYYTPDYWVHRAMASYDVNQHLGLQLNISNLTDEEYHERVRNNGWATPGAGRNAVFSATWRR